MCLEVLGGVNNNLTYLQLISASVDALLMAINAKAISNVVHIQFLYLTLQYQRTRGTCNFGCPNKCRILNPVYTISNSLDRLLYRGLKIIKTVENHPQLIIMFGRRVGLFL